MSVPFESKVGTTTGLEPVLLGSVKSILDRDTSYPAPPFKILRPTILPFLTVGSKTAAVIGIDPPTLTTIISACAVAPVPSPVTVTLGVKLYLLPLVVTIACDTTSPSKRGVAAADSPGLTR